MAWGDRPKTSQAAGPSCITFTETKTSVIALEYTLTLLPGETMTLYQSDRYRRTTSETERYSTQTTFSQFVSDSSLLVQVLNSQAQSSNASGGGGINLIFIPNGP